MSKLGVHVSSGDRRGFGDWLRDCAEAGSPVPVVFSVGQDVWPDIERYSPSTLVIFRAQNDDQGHNFGDGPGGIYTGNPIESARGWMDKMMRVWRKNHAHYYAPWNEQDPPTIAAFKWLVAFTDECQNIGHANGFKLGLYAFSAGNPKDVLHPAIGDPFTRDDSAMILIPSLQRAKREGDILLLHEYGLHFGTLRASQPWLALRYRHLYRLLRQYNADAPLAISEASKGVGFSGNPEEWRRDLQWYDSELMKDRVVIGCCMYQAGGAENLKEQFAPLTTYMKSAKTPPLLEQADPVVPGPDRNGRGEIVPDDFVFLVAPPTQAGEAYRVVCAALYVRAAPSTAAPRVAALPKGATFRVIEKRIADGFEWGRHSKGWSALRVIVEALTEEVV